jgi:phosphoglycerol geranylgeranyltransferase
MDIDWRGISHVTKVDPAEPLPADLEILEHTDLVIVGGSDGVTEANSLSVMERLGSSIPDVPVLQEPYSSEHVSKDTIAAADSLAVPAVYNGDRANFVDKHVEFFTEVGSKPEAVMGAGLPIVGDLIASRGREAIAEISDRIVGEGYVIQNLESKAARVSGVDSTFTPEEVAGAALATESFYGFPIFYVEYSGTYGGTEDVEAAATYLDDTTLLYGGGIESHAQTEAILDAGADAVVVGDCFHDDPDRFLETIP